MSRLGYQPSSTALPARATALGRGTHGVPDIRRMVESQFHVAFPHRIWVSGLVGLSDVEDEGTVRFLLHPSTTEEEFCLPCVVPGSSVPGLRELLRRGQDADLEDVVREGRLAKVGGLLRYDAVRGSLAFVVSDLDATPTGLGLAEERESALRAVAASGLVERQRMRTRLTAPLHVALVGDARDDALARVEEQLSRSRFSLQLRLLPVALTTPTAPRLLAEAVRSAADDSDLVLLVRAEGRPLRLSSYDALEAAQAVADAPVPVVTGLGGGAIRTACDEVAFTVLPTAAAAARWVLALLTDAQRSLDVLRDEVDREVAAASARARQMLDDARTEVDSVAEEATVRAAAARRRRWLLLLACCAPLVVLAVVAALLTGRPLLLLALLLPAAVLLGVRVWSRRARTRGSRRMGQRDDDFGQVLERLRGVRDDLAATSSPEKVAGLRDLAWQLVDQGERLLARHLEQPPDPPPPAPEEGDVASHGAPPPAADAAPRTDDVTARDVDPPTDRL